MTEKLKNRLWSLLAIVLGVGVIVLMCCLQGCAQGILVIEPVKDGDGSYLRQPDGRVVMRIKLKANTLLKDITWGDYTGTSNKFKVIGPPFYIDTEESDDGAK